MKKHLQVPTTIKNSKIMHKMLLYDLVTIVDKTLGLQKSTVRDVNFECANLIRLEDSIRAIFRDGIKIFKTDGSPDFWTIVEGLSFINPSIKLDVDEKWIKIRKSNKNNTGLLWIFQSLENNNLSQNSKWLLSDHEHMANCYENSAFLRHQNYVDAFLICLNALERNQMNLLSQVDPALYNEKAGKENYQCHKRSTSHPHFSIIANKMTTKEYTKRRQTVGALQRRKVVKLHLRTWKSLPNIFVSSQKCDPEPVATPKKPILKVPQFDYNDKSTNTPKTASPYQNVSVLNTTNIKIHVPEERPLAKKTSYSDFGSILGISGSPRSILSEFFPQYGEKIQKTPNASSADILHSLNSRPIAGQSLTSFLKSVYFSRTFAELDRENAHFSLSEALIATFEQLKWNEAEKCGGKKLKRRISASSFSSNSSSRVYSPHKSSYDGSKNISPSSMPSNSTSFTIQSDPESSSEGSEKNSSNEKLNVLEWGENDVKAYSAEGVALSLISKFSDKQLPSASDLLWLVSEQDVPQQLLPMPEGNIVNPDDHLAIHTFIRGTKEWAPPRAQIIFTRHPPPDRKQLMAKQNQRCAGCGMKVAPAYSHRYRYCEYLGKYNCSGCHKNQMSAIPARVIDRWDFSLHPVSVFSYRLLNDLWAYPLFRIHDLNPNLYKIVKPLQDARFIRVQLKFIKDFITTCRFSELLKSLFNNVPSHLTADTDIWSMADFVAVQNGSFQKDVLEFIKRCEKHVLECELCRARGFYCEYCTRKDLIFPWQKRVIRCKLCGVCSHDTCWTAECSKCVRLHKRKLSTKS